IYLLLDANDQRIVGNVDTIGRAAKADYVDASDIDFSGHNDNEWRAPRLSASLSAGQFLVL
ncbi:hypothetical protein, partial [Tritonibacter scottomollicae]|uniref:hypothetical protein n=1 Tax=Tritonibacter scottomollicae TaxID=483013 RepID=UPI003BAC9E67